MAKRLVEMMPRQAKRIFYTSSLQSSLFAHRNNLLGNRKHHLITINQNKADRYRGDFIGLLIEEGVPVDLHPIICELNDLLDPTDYDGTLLTITVPFQEDINDIVIRHKCLDN